MILEASGWSNWILGPVLGRGGSQAGQTGGGILLVHVYRKERKGAVWISPGVLVLFKLVAPPLQPGVVGPYPV
jgi:hypothetical protein